MNFVDKVIFRNIKLYCLSLSLFLAYSFANASSCELNGVSFSELNEDQRVALRSVGATCSESSSSFKFGDKSYFIVDGEKLEFIDIKAEDPYDLMGKDFSYTGYIGNYVQEMERDKVWGYRFDGYVDEGSEYLKSIKIMQSGENIPLLAVANPSTQSVEEAKAARKSIFKFFNKAKGLNSIVEITGRMMNFGNTGDLYLELNTYRIVESLK